MRDRKNRGEKRGYAELAGVLIILGIILLGVGLFSYLISHRGDSGVFGGAELALGEVEDWETGSKDDSLYYKKGEDTMAFEEHEVVEKEETSDDYLNASDAVVEDNNVIYLDSEYVTINGERFLKRNYKVNGEYYSQTIFVSGGSAVSVTSQSEEENEDYQSLLDSTTVEGEVRSYESGCEGLSGEELERCKILQCESTGGIYHSSSDTCVLPSEFGDEDESLTILASDCDGIRDFSLSVSGTTTLSGSSSDGGGEDCEVSLSDEDYCIVSSLHWDSSPCGSETLLLKDDSSLQHFLPERGKVGDDMFLCMNVSDTSTTAWNASWTPGSCSEDQFRVLRDDADSDHALYEGTRTSENMSYCANYTSITTLSDTSEVLRNLSWFEGSTCPEDWDFVLRDDSDTEHQVFENSSNMDSERMVLCADRGTITGENCYDSIDNDCDGAVDYDDTDCSFFIQNDTDKDGFLNESAEGMDCDDSDSSVYPNASELDGEKDYDCDGVVDNNICSSKMGEPCGLSEGVCSKGNITCEGVCGGEGLVEPSQELCGDELDNDCDGSTDESECKNQLADPTVKSFSFETSCSEGFNWSNEEARCVVVEETPANVSGTVFLNDTTDDEKSLERLEGAEVTADPIYKDLKVREVVSNSTGDYNISEIYPACYIFSASKDGLFPDYKSEVCLAPGSEEEMNFTLRSGECNDDCVNAEGRCNPGCDGVGGCSFYDDTAKDRCDGKKQGSVWKYNETHNIECCEGDPKPKPELASSDISGCMDELVKTSRIIEWKGESVVMNVYTWKSCE